MWGGCNNCYTGITLAALLPLGGFVWAISEMNSMGPVSPVTAVQYPSASLVANSKSNKGSINSNRLLALKDAPALAVNHGGPFTADTIADIAEEAAPSVVNIEIRRKDESGANGMPNLDLFDLPNFGNGNFRFFYNGREVSPSNPVPRYAPKVKRASATGSGFVIRPDGYIMTNAHLVKGASDIRVSLTDKRSFHADVVGADSFSDLAVLKISASDLPALKMGSSDKLRPGEFAIAIGSPLGFDHTVTLGIISAVGRTIANPNTGNANFIQTDAAINPGNSGGPLLNLRGEAIGVNTAMQADAQNIGFSTPIDLARSVADDLINHRSISRPWLGIGMSELNEMHAKSLNLPLNTRGVFISKVYENSPAQQAGIEPGDIIQKLEGNKVIHSPKDVQETVRSRKVNDTVKFTLLRGTTIKEVSVTIGHYPDLNPAQSSTSTQVPLPGAIIISPDKSDTKLPAKPKPGEKF